MKRYLALLICLALALGLLAVSAAVAAPVEMKFGHVAPPFHGQAKGCDAFAAYVKDKTKGAIEIKTFPAGQLGGEASLADQVQAGTLQMASVTTAVLQNFVPQLAICDLPFVYPDRKTAYAVLDDPEVQAKLFGLLPAKGFVGVGWTENEFRDISNSKRDIRKPDDLKGLKIRVMESPIYIDTFEQLGATAVGIPFPQLYSALQNKTVDAQENPLLTTILIKATEITKHVTMTNHILTECVIIVNKDAWDKLTPEQQGIFKEAGKVCIKTNREVNAELMKKLPKLDMSVEEYCKKNDVKVIQLTPEERDAFKKATSPVWEKYREKIGAELFDFFLKKVEQHSAKK